ncbi:hypothetical protein CR513_11197, partial [Mucuna pruriens]
MTSWYLCGFIIVGDPGKTSQKIPLLLSRWILWIHANPRCTGRSTQGDLHLPIRYLCVHARVVWPVQCVEYVSTLHDKHLLRLTTYGMILIFGDSIMIKLYTSVSQTSRSIQSSNFVMQHLEAAIMDQFERPGRCLIAGSIGSPFSKTLINLSPLDHGVADLPRYQLRVIVDASLDPHKWNVWEPSALDNYFFPFIPLMGSSSYICCETNGRSSTGTVNGYNISDSSRSFHSSSLKCSHSGFFSFSLSPTPTPLIISPLRSRRDNFLYKSNVGTLPRAIQGGAHIPPRSKLVGNL